MKKSAALILVIAIAILPVFCACTDTGTNSPAGAAAKGETKTTSWETAPQEDEATTPSTAPAAEPVTEPTAVTTTVTTPAATTVTTTVPSAEPTVEPTVAEESTPPPQTAPSQAEYHIGIDTEGAAVYESGNDVIVSWADRITIISGAAGNIDEQFTDYFVYGGIYYINVSNDPTWESYEYTPGDELLEITGISEIRKLSQLSDGTSSKLAIGTKIYSCETRPDMLLALVDGEYLPYYKMVEG